MCSGVIGLSPRVAGQPDDEPGAAAGAADRPTARRYCKGVITTPRPWLDSYAAGVPHDIDAPDGVPRRPHRGVGRQYPDNVALEFFGRDDHLRRARRPDRARGRGAAPARRAEGRPGRPRAARTARSTSSPSTPCCGSAPSSSSTTRSTRRASCAISSRTTAPRSSSPGTRWSRHIQDFPADIAVDHDHLGRRHPGDAVHHPGRAAASDQEGARVARGPHHDGARHRSRGTSCSRRTDRCSIHRSRQPSTDVALIQYTSGTTGHRRRARPSPTSTSPRTPRRRARGCRPSSAAPSRRLRRAADVPRLRPHALPHLRDEHGRAARAVPALRPRPRARGHEEAPGDLPAGRAARSTSDCRHAAKEKGVSLAGIQIAISGAMPLRAAVVEPWEAETGGYLVEGYGLSRDLARCSWPTRCARRASPEPSGCRCRAPSCASSTRRTRRGSRCRMGDEGELIVRGPQVFSGYWKQAGRDRRGLRARRWLVPHRRHRHDRRRGLRAHRRPHQGAHHHRRLQRGAERGRGGAASRFPDVADVAVVGLPSEHSGEEVVAAVVLRDGRLARRGGHRGLRARHPHGLQGAARSSSSSRSCPSRSSARCCVARCATSC